MKYCIHCRSELIHEAKFCSSCGKSQDGQDFQDNHDLIQLKKKGNSAFLTTLCILTLVGYSIGIFRGLLYQSFAVGVPPGFGNSEYIRGWLFVIVNIGTIVGAAILLGKKVIGLYIYSMFQVLYLLIIIWATSVYLGDRNTDQLALTISAFFFIPSLAFLIMYWTKPIRENLH